MMSHSLDGLCLFVLHLGLSSSCLSLGFHYGIPFFVGSRLLHCPHIGLSSDNVNLFGGLIFHLPQSVMRGVGHSGGQVHMLLR